MNSARFTTGAVSRLAILSLVLACGIIGPAAAEADSTDAEDVTRGEAVYMERCASCHGANLEGQPNWRVRLPDGRLPAPPHDETGHTWHHPDAVLFELTKYGPQVIAGADYVSDMPAYAEELSDSDIWAVLSYIKSRWPTQMQARSEMINRAYEADQGGKQ